MIDDQSEPGAWKDALRFPSAIRQLPDTSDTCRPATFAAGNLGAADSLHGIAAPLSDQSIAHAAADTSKVDE